MKFDPLSTTYNGSTAFATYTSIKDHVMKYIQKTYKGGADVAESLRTMELVDLDADAPVRERLGDTGLSADTIAVLNIAYQEKLRKHLDRKEALSDGMKKAFALIFDSYCTRKMQHKVEEHVNYDTQVHNDPIALLEVIQQNMHTRVQAQPECVTVYTAIHRLYNDRQRENEPLLDYYKRYKENRDIFHACCGKMMYMELAKLVDGFDTMSADNKHKMVRAADERMSTVIFMLNADRGKYGTIMDNLSAQYALGNDQYPVTLSAALDVLSNHKLDNGYHRSKHKERKNKQRDKSEAKAEGKSFAQHGEVTC